MQISPELIILVHTNLGWINNSFTKSVNMWFNDQIPYCKGRPKFF